MLKICRAVSVVWLLVALTAPAGAQPPDPLAIWLNQIAQKQLSAREAQLQTISGAAEARARQVAVRAKILGLLGGLPDYNGPLNARVTGSIERTGYSIEKVLFESLPGYLVSANVYLPQVTGKTTQGKHPAVLFALGHWDEGKPAAQQIAANLALKGFVVLAFDPVGQGERVQAWTPLLRASVLGGSTEQHTTLGAQSLWLGQSFARYRIWDAKRALDYLVSRPEVDAERVGASGCSGGGTVTTYIAALDPRIKAAAPACYVNSFREVFPGPTGDAEQSLPGFVEAGLDIADYIELFAPKPWLIGSTREDFFPLAGAQRAFAEAQRWYGWFGADDRVKWTVGPGGHGTPPEVREAIYSWMIRWLTDGSASSQDVPVELLPEWQLWASEDGQVGGRQLYEILQEEYGRLHKPLDRAALIEAMKAEMKRAATDTPPPLEFAPVSAFAFAGNGDQLLIRGGGKILRYQSPVPHAFTGNWLTATRALMTGQSLPLIRIRQIQAAIDAMGSSTGASSGGGAGVEIAARGMPAVWAAAAALLDSRVARVSLDRMPLRVAAAFQTPVLRNPYDALLFPGFALHWELADLLDGRAVLSDPVDWNGVIVPRVSGARYRGFGETDKVMQ